MWIVTDSRLDHPSGPIPAEYSEIRDRLAFNTPFLVPGTEIDDCDQLAFSALDLFDRFGISLKSHILEKLIWELDYVLAEILCG